jgi:hypothetical protein
LVIEEFKNRLLIHARTAVDRAGRAPNEEATKQFLIIPFFHLLGYDPNDPDEVVSEADASFFGQIQESGRLRDLQGG